VEAKKRKRKRKSKYKYKNRHRESLSRRELKLKAIEYKGGCCEACAYSKCVAALSFHHRDPTQKDFGISRLINTMSWPRIVEELDKCSLLCLVCHTEVHSGMLDGYWS
jgi:hypothetical protein